MLVLLKGERVPSSLKTSQEVDYPILSVFVGFIINRCMEHVEPGLFNCVF